MPLPKEKIQPGTRVRCLDHGGNINERFHLVVGKIYTVVEDTRDADECLTISDETGVSGYRLAERFELADREPLTKDQRAIAKAEADLQALKDRSAENFRASRTAALPIAFSNGTSTPRASLTCSSGMNSTRSSKYRRHSGSLARAALASSRWPARMRWASALVAGWGGMVT